MGTVHSCGLNKVIAISGGCTPYNEKKTIIGDWGWAWWFFSDVQSLSLNLMTLNPECQEVMTLNGVPVTVSAVARVKVMREEAFLKMALEQFLGKMEDEIKSTVLESLEGHLRAILATMTVEEINQNMPKFTAMVKEVSAPDLGRMGMEILSFTIRDIRDDVEYLDSLGMTRTAAVRRDADIGVAEANRDAEVRKAECIKEAMDTKYSTDAKIEMNTKAMNVEKASFETEVNAALATANLAYELEGKRLQQGLMEAEMNIEVVERRKEIEIEEKEIERREKELFATVKIPAEAIAFKTQILAEGMKFKKLSEAQGESEKIKQIGKAEAIANEAIGKAEANGMKMKAEAYKEYGDAALVSMVLEVLPHLAGEVASPLKRTKEIIVTGGEQSATNKQVTNLMATLPHSVQALTGVDITGVLGKMTGSI